MSREKNVGSDEVRISDDHKMEALGVIEEKLRNMSSSDQEFRFLHKLLHKTRYFEEELKHLVSSSASSSSTLGCQVNDDRQFELQLRNKIQMAKQKFLSSSSSKRNSGTISSNSNHQLANKNESQSSSLNLSSKLDQSNKKSLVQTGKETATAVQLYRHIDTMKWIRFLSRNTLGKMDPFWSILLLVGGSSIATFGQLLRLLAANRRVSERNHANSSGPNGQVLFRSRL